MKDNRLARLKTNIAPLMAFLVTPVMVLAIGWFGDIAKDFLTGPWLALACGLLLLGSFATFFWLIRLNGSEPFYDKSKDAFNWRLPAKILLFFIVTLTMAVLVTLVTDALKAPLKTIKPHHIIAFFSIALVLLDWATKTINHNDFAIKPMCGVLGVGFVLAVIQNDGKDYGWPMMDLLGLAAMACVIAYAFYLFVRISRYFIRPYNHLKDRKIAPSKHVIMFLSSVKEPMLEMFDLLTTAEKPSKPTFLAYAEKLKQLCDEKSKENAAKSGDDRQVLNPWEMPLRALVPHQSSVKAVTIVVSGAIEQSNASAPQALGLLKVLARIHSTHAITFRVLFRDGDQYSIAQYDGEALKYKGSVIDLKDENGLPFDNFEATTKAVYGLLDQPFCKALGYQDTVLDITGGLKVTTVVGTLVSMSFDTTCQYVNTNATKKVQAFDFRLLDPTKVA